MALEGREEGGRERFSLVDGLQRTTAILELMHSPLKVISLESIVGEQFFREVASQFSEYLPLASERAFAGAVEDWLPSVSDLSRSSGFDWDDLRMHVRGELDPREVASDLWNRDSTVRMFKSLLDEIERAVRAAGEVQIAALVYRGPKEHLPYIFERLNSSGTPLTRYEIFAASWGQSAVSGEDDRVRHAVAERYASLAELGYELNFIFDEGAPLNLFEYLFGLGKVLAEEFPFLFPDSPKPSDESPTAFVLATIVYQLQLSQMSQLEGRMREQLGNVFDVSAFERAVLESCGAVQRSIAPIVSLQIRTSAKTRFIAHSQNQILSLIARYMIEMYEQETWQRVTDRERIAQAKKILRWVPHFLLFDVISENWKGSGDSRLFRSVWETVDSGSHDSRDGQGFRPAPMYLSPPTDDDWNIALAQWHSRQLKKSQITRTSISVADKLVLKYIYSARISHLENQSVEFEIEHVYPVSGLKVRIEKAGDDGWPISAVSNLALMPARTNREKGVQTVADFLTGLSSESSRGRRRADPAVTEEHLRSAVIGPQAESLDWHYGSRRRSSGFLRGDFEEFLSDRWGFQRAAISDALARLSNQ